VIRNETFRDGICVEADVYDLDAGIYLREEMGVVVATRPITDEERRLFGPQPLDRIGVVATLNAVLGVWSIDDAAHAADVSRQALIDEALAWAAAEVQT
jgi:hypothetical protein